MGQIIRRIRRHRKSLWGLLQAVRFKIRGKHYNLRTEEAYLLWIKRFIRFHGQRHPRGLGPQEVEAFLTHLAADLTAAARTKTGSRGNPGPVSGSAQYRLALAAGCDAGQTSAVLLAVDQPGHAELIGHCAETHRPEGFIQRHLHRAVLRQRREDAFRLGDAVDA